MTVDENTTANEFQYRTRNEITVQTILTMAINNQEEAKTNFHIPQKTDKESKPWLDRKTILLEKPNTTPMAMNTKTLNLTVEKLKANYTNKLRKWARKKFQDKTTKELDNLQTEYLVVQKRSEIGNDDSIHKIIGTYVLKNVKQIMPDDANPQKVHVTSKHQLMNNTFTLTTHQVLNRFL